MSEAAALKDPVIWLAAKKTIHMYLDELRNQHGLTSAETAYDVIEAEENLAIFRIHNSLRLLLENEIQKRSLKKSYQITFSEVESKSDTCDMKIEACGYESYIFAGMLSGVSSDLHEIKNQNEIRSKAAILSTIAEVLAAKNVKGKFSSGLKLAKGIYSVSIVLKDFPELNPVKFQNSDHLALISEIAQELPKKIPTRRR